MIDFSEIFDRQYRDLCNPNNRKHEKYQLDHRLFQRGDGFAMIWKKLLQKSKTSYRMAETGVLRRPGNWIDGQSTLLFQEFLRTHGGRIDCVDINDNNCAEARRFLDPNLVHVTCDDSLNFLKNIDATAVDLWHLDSRDVKWNHDHDSAQHHLNEFLIIESRLQPGALVMIDDNAWRQGRRTGKGRMIVEYLAAKNKKPIYDAYQIIFEF